MYYEPADIGRAGEEVVKGLLVSKGWKITSHDTKGPGSTDLEAKAGGAQILVQVKTAVPPSNPSSLSSEEERNIKSRATRIGAGAYEARVWLTQPVKVEWRHLNKEN